MSHRAGRKDIYWAVLTPNDPRLKSSSRSYQNPGIDEPQNLNEPLCSPLNSTKNYLQLELPESVTTVPSYAELLQEWKEQEHLKRLWISYNVFQVPCSWHESQDGVTPQRPFLHNVNGNCFRAAVSDGATKSYQAADYATILTRIFAEHGERVFHEVRLLLAAGEWELVQEDKIKYAFPDAPEQRNVEMRYLKHCSAEATLNGVEFDLVSMTYKDSSVGDTVFFEVQRFCDAEMNESQAVILSQNPSMTSADFAGCPKRLSTKTMSGHYIDEHDISTRSGALTLEHHYLICSAALARFLLQEDADFPQGEKLACLLSFSNEDEFRAFCLEQKIYGRLEDDDITFVKIWISKDAE